MTFWEILFIGIGLAMDAFAVSICKGLRMNRFNHFHTFMISLTFGLFQAGMPAIGFFIGRQFESYITQIDHWIAFVLLSFIGLNMIKEALTPDEQEDSKEDRLDVKELIMMAIATSIDALAIGITFAFFKVDLGSAISLIGLVTFVICYIGVVIGHLFGAKFKEKAEMAGGIILMGIGLKILLEHLGILII